MTNRTSKSSLNQSIRRTQYHLPGTSIGFEVHNYNVTGGVLPPIIRPTKKRRSKLETSPFLITAEEVDSYLEKMAKTRDDTEFSFQRDMCLSEDLQAIQHRSRLSTFLRDRDQYDYVLQSRASHYVNTHPRLSTSWPSSNRVQATDPLVLSHDPVIVLAAHATAPPEPQSASLLLRSCSTPMLQDPGNQNSDGSGSKCIRSRVDDQNDISNSQLNLSALDGLPTDLHSGEPEGERRPSAVFHGFPKLSMQQGSVASIKIGDTAVSVCDIVTDAQELKTAQLVSPTHISSQQLRTPDQLVDLDMLSYDPNDVRDQILTVSNRYSQLSRELVYNTNQRMIEQKRRNSGPLAITGSSVLDKDRVEDETLKHNRQRHKQVVGVFTRQLKSELAGRAKSGKAAQIGGYMLYSLDMTINPDQIKQKAASQKLLELDPAKAMPQIPAIRPLPPVSCTSSSLICRSKSNPAANKRPTFILYSDYKK